MTQTRHFSENVDIEVNSGLPLVVNAEVYEGRVIDWGVVQVGRKKVKKTPRFVERYAAEIEEKLSAIYG